YWRLLVWSFCWLLELEDFLLLRSFQEAALQVRRKQRPPTAQWIQQRRPRKGLLNIGSNFYQSLCLASRCVLPARCPSLLSSRLSFISFSRKMAMCISSDPVSRTSQPHS